MGRVWCGGARETHLATCHNGVTSSKTKEFLKSPCFLDINGTYKNEDFVRFKIESARIESCPMIIVKVIK